MIPAHVRARVQRRRTRGQRGAVVVEMAFIAMLLLLFISAVWDYGFAWREGLAASEAARSGARVGSGQNVSPGTDYYALSSLRSSLTASGLINSVNKVVIYKSTTTDGVVPASCVAATPSGTCNVLTGAQLKAMTTSSFSLTIPTDPNQKPTGTGCLTTSAAQLAGWCPNARSNVQDTGADYYGIYVELSHKNQFPFTPKVNTIKRTAVMRLEPTGFGG